jgi:Ca2+-binding RTX toxin-like protein
MSALNFAFESLEPRKLFSAAPGALILLDGATLRVLGERNFSNAITVSTADDGDSVVVRLNGYDEVSFDRIDIASIVIEGGRRNDRITVREPEGRIDLPMTIRGGSGNDVVDLDFTPAIVDGGSGNDTLLGSDGDDTLHGGDNNDRVFGGPGDDTLGGGSGNDDIRGDDGDDQLRGERGNDTLDGGFGNDRLDGGVGSNRLVDRARPGELNVFFGGRGWNTIYGTTTDEFRNIDDYFDRVFLARPLFSSQPID